MKKNYLVIVLLFSIFTVKAQNNNNNIENLYEKKNEVKLNVTSILFGAPEVSYERNLNKKSSLGISFLTVFDNENPNEDLNYFITPYYRRYFGKKYASGFFGEGFGTLSSIDGIKIFDLNGNLTSEKTAVTDFSLGLGLGGKWVTKSGFTFETSLSYGFLLFNGDKTDGQHSIVARFGFHLGYRF
jgi:hypothetical protein